jgi:hypothetical protein
MTKAPCYRMSVMSPMTARQLASHADNLELINEEVSASLARQSAAGDRIDSKAVFLVGYAGAASSFLATRPYQPVFAGAAFGAFAAAAAAGILAYAIRLQRDVPEPRRLLNHYLPMPRTQTLAALASSRVAAFEINVGKQRTKGRLWWASLGGVAIGMVLMSLALASRYWSP